MSSGGFGEDEAEPELAEMTRLLSLSRRRTRTDLVALARLTGRLAQAEAAARRRSGDNGDAELTALLAEYESLRTESIQTVNNRTQVMLLGLAAIAALVGGALTIDDPTKAAGKILVYSVFSGAVPLVFLFISMVWLSEAVRAHRVGYFLASDVEPRINQKLGRLVLTWESSLWTAWLPRDAFGGPSMMALGVLWLLSAAAPVFGIWLSRTPLDRSFRTVALLGLPIAIFVVGAMYAFANRSRLKNKPELSAAFFEGET